MGFASLRKRLLENKGIAMDFFTEENGTIALVIAINLVILFAGLYAKNG